MEELKTFGLLQAQIQQRTEELQALRLSLIPPTSEDVKSATSKCEPEGTSVNAPETELRPTVAKTTEALKSHPGINMTSTTETDGAISQRVSGPHELSSGTGSIGPDNDLLSASVKQPLLSGEPRSDGGLQSSEQRSVSLDGLNSEIRRLQETKGQRSAGSGANIGHSEDGTNSHSSVIGLSLAMDNVGVCTDSQTDNGNVAVRIEQTTDHSRSTASNFTTIGINRTPGNILEMNHREGSGIQETPDLDVCPVSLTGGPGNDSKTTTGTCIPARLPEAKIGHPLYNKNSQSYSDLGWHSPEYLQNFSSSSSPPSVHVPRWESTDSPPGIMKSGLRGDTATGRILLDSLTKESKLEVQLSHAQIHIQKLKAHIDQLEKGHREDTRKNQTTIEGLLIRLDEITRCKQNQINERVNECKAKDQVITQLTKTLQDAETTVNVLEQTITNSKQDLCHEMENSARKDQALLQIYHSVMGEAHEEGEANRTLTPQTVIERVKGYMDGQEGHIRGLERRLRESEAMCQSAREDLGSTVERLTVENKQRLSQLNEEHSKLMEAATERSVNARQQTLGLQAQLDAVEDHSRQELESKSTQIIDLTERLKAQTEGNDTVRILEQEKLSKSQEEVQSTAAKLEVQLSQVSLLEEQQSVLKTEIAELKDSLRTATVNLEEEREARSEVTLVKNQSEAALEEYRRLLEEKSADLERVSAKMSEEKNEQQRNFEDEISLVRKQSNARISEEKTKHEIGMKEHQGKLSNLEEERGQILSNLKSSEDRYTSTLSKMRELESTLEIMAREKADLASILEGRDRDLTVLRHERELLENMLEKLRKESQTDLLDRDAIQRSLDEISPRYHKLLADNQKLSAEVEQRRQENEKLSSEKEDLVSVVEKTKTEWEKVRELKNDLCKKLQVREATQKHLGEDLEQARSDSVKLTTEMKCLHGENKSLRRACNDLKLKLSQMSEDKDKTHQQTTEKQAKAEKESGLMNSQIKILQRELRTVRGTMKANQAVDGKAIEVAAGMKRDVALQRDLVESLQGEITWLEECLQESQQRSEQIMVEKNQLRALLQRAEKRLGRSREENQAMTNKKRDQKGLVLKLEAALEKAALKYGESQQRNERQAQELAQLRLQHQLELKELKGNLLNQLTSKFTMPPKVENHSPNNLRSTPTKKVEKSMGQAVHTSVDSVEADPGVQADLKTLLQGVLKSMILESGAASPLQEEGIIQQPRKSSTPRKHNSRNRDTGDIVPSPPDHEDDFSTHTGSTSSRLSASPAGPPGLLDQHPMSPSSPVSTLLGQETVQQDDQRLLSYGSYTGASKNTRKKPAYHGEAPRSPKDNSNSESKMRGLQEKLGRLAAMGSKLRDHTKEMELFLEDEDS